ncbi:hypothetical protein KP509_04G044400 [Ceratopteris richardii]|uniref:Uncharacterized protein n=1 Tax=Ceratopteris richardii TaxID=49495 RepID=A0A8T2V4C6_CERRI|nr:hypothetical protein KP509_04G044400 [Ceratopteris richardii]
MEEDTYIPSQMNSGGVQWELKLSSSLCVRKRGINTSDLCICKYLITRKSDEEEETQIRQCRNARLVDP